MGQLQIFGDPRTVALAAIPRRLFTGKSQFAASAATTTALHEAGAAGATGGNSGNVVFDFDPANYALAGFTTKLKLSGLCITNATAPGTDVTLGLFPATSPAGGTSGSLSHSLGSLVSGSGVTFTAPASGSQLRSGVTFTAPASGCYVVGLTIVSNMAANAAMAVRGTLHVLNVQP